MGRNILLITTDQMRFDALGCNGGIVARTPVIDALAAEGINYLRAHNPVSYTHLTLPTNREV